MVLSHGDQNKTTDLISTRNKIFHNRLLLSHTSFKDRWLFIPPNDFTAPYPPRFIKVIHTPGCLEGNYFLLEKLPFPIISQLGWRQCSSPTEHDLDSRVIIDTSKLRQPRNAPKRSVHLANIWKQLFFFMDRLKLQSPSSGKHRKVFGRGNISLSCDSFIWGHGFKLPCVGVVTLAGSNS